MCDKKICINCGVEKTTKDFWKRCITCKKCQKEKLSVEVTCIKCGKTRTVTGVAARVNKSGLCGACAQKIERNRPEVKEAQSKRAREQVLKQGGIPNANRFSEEHWGENHWNWKGGITPEVMKIRNSEDTKKWRKAVYERDNYTCQECGKVGGKLNAHHIKSFSDYPELRFDLDNGITLCVPCHTKTHNYGYKVKKECSLQ